jgi:transglutaminase-like putative cysteine protease
MWRLSIRHDTRYTFSAPVMLGPHQLLLRPREGHNLLIQSSKLDISPPATLRWHSDAFDNSVAVATFNSATTELAISSEVAVQQYDAAPFDFIVADHAVNFPFAYSSPEIAVLSPFLGEGRQDASLLDWIGSIWRYGEPIQTFALLTRLNGRINTAFSYQAREQIGVQTPEETIRRGIGSCRDFANLLIHAARSLGLAARFVSGYLNVPSLHAFSGSTHAWAQIYIPGAGWKGFDPTIGEVVGDKHIPVAVARSAQDVPPVSGSFFGSAFSNLTVGVDVREIQT